MTRRNNNTGWLAITAAIVTWTPFALAAPAKVDGAAIAATGVPAKAVPACTACHGVSGEGLSALIAPRLAGLNPDYLQRQLDAFASGARQNPVMAPIAKGLTPAQRAAVSHYFAGRAESAAPDPEAAAPTPRGKTLATEGDWSVQAPACGSCHGPKGEGVGSVTPPLAGQSQAYLEAQLTSFRSGERKGDSLGLMAGVAKRLSEADLKAAATYYASLNVTSGGDR